MSKQVLVSDDVKDLVADIMRKCNIKSNSDVKYETGSEAGDGYASKTVAVSIKNPRESLDLFIKYGLDIKSPGPLPMEKYYANEVYFYDTVYPAFLTFLNERAIETGFRNVPKCYGTLKGNLIAMENLKKKGYALFDRTTVMNHNHIALVLKTFAKFHALSFAFKACDQVKYEKLTEGTFDGFSAKYGNMLPKMVRNRIKEFLSNLDVEDDKDILEKCNLEDLLASLTSADLNLNKYSIITQGDCWCNNMMFFYEKDGLRETPLDVILVDWQLLRPASPVFDISYFFYTIACEEALNKTEEYLRLYHDHLSEEIQRITGEPNTLYPFAVLKKEWRQHSKYGFVMGFLIIKAMLSAKDEVFEIEKMDFDNEDTFSNLYPKFDKEDEFMLRMRTIARHLIKTDCL